MRIPSATYRVQFNREFRFAHALEIVPHLQRLGISHLYASPVFAARPGSMHGYDVTDPNRLNPELGEPAEFYTLCDALRAHDMGLVLDIVPNHMAASPENKWWMDVLENGSASQYVIYFGIHWDSRDVADEKIFLPILGNYYGAVLEAGELKLSYAEGSLYLNYWETRLPLAPASYAAIVRPACEVFPDNPDVQFLLESMERLPSLASMEWEAMERREVEKENIKTRIAHLASAVPGFEDALQRSINALNGIPGDVDSFDGLHAIIEEQAYRVAYWMVARDRINYRRFFDVSELIGMRVQREEVYKASHQLILQLVEERRIDGIRIDHIDGLNDPLGYLERLPRDVYTVAEKILVGTEQLSDTWPIQGTSGYDYLGYSNSLFVNAEGFTRLDWLYREVIGFTQSLEDVEYDRKQLAMRTLFPGEIADLGAGLSKLAAVDRYARDLSPRDITRALREITACLHVYRTYMRDFSVSDVDRERILSAMHEAEARSGGLIDTQAFAYVSRILTLQFRHNMTDESKNEWVRFVRRWQQLSGPVMAKGVEDSTFYVYNRLVSLNEVGSLQKPVSSAEMHEFLRDRAQRWPGAMNGSSTHDTKRSEDVRARISVLSEISEEWIRHVTRWRRSMRDRRGPVDDNEEYFIYQNLLGAWPLDEIEVPEFRERFRKYLTKSAREARVHSTWIKPNEESEAALHAFADVLFDDQVFQKSFQSLLAKVAYFGALNSLSQLLLKVCSPGVPDFYRGTITWDLSLVDPDNRRPVEFAPLTDFDEPAKQVLTHWQDGRVKVYVTEKALAFRRVHADLFAEGEYIPLEVRGKRSANVFAFLRRRGDQHALVMVPLFPAQLSSAPRPPVGLRVWDDTMIVLPEGSQRNWRNKFTNERLSTDGQIPAARAFAHFPIALLSCI
ncbi:MAG: malto-oligosyltrehalose synthase [Bryobacteraceae bacterium]|nr:malto-oligosyltrehalose synthase [Bryobacteraceae bacterium]